MNNLVGTNLELFGSEIEQKIKEASAKSEPIWNSIDMTIPYLYIWRARNFKLEPIKQENAGMFYEGDSYIVFNIYKGADGSLVYNIHFWLGNQTTADEMGTVAYKTVELDTFLHGKATQFREVQGNESDLFRSYFPQGITYKIGGVESGFKKVQAYDYSNYSPLLYRIKNSSVTHMPLILASVTEDDVFVLDNGLTVMVYNGQNSSHFERLLADYTAVSMRDSRKGCEVQLVSNLETFNSYLTNSTNSQHDTSSSKLFKINEQDGKVNTIEIGEPITMKSFDTNDAFLFCTSHTTFIWVGKNSTWNELTNAWKMAFSVTSPTTPISLVKEGNEPEVFKMSVH